MERGGRPTGKYVTDGKVWTADNNVLSVRTFEGSAEVQLVWDKDFAEAHGEHVQYFEDFVDTLRHKWRV